MPPRPAPVAYASDRPYWGLWRSRQVAIGVAGVADRVLRLLHRLRQQRDRAQPPLQARRLVDGDELVGLGLLAEVVEVVAHLARRADGGVPEHLVHVPPGRAAGQLVRLLVAHFLGRDADVPGEQADRPRPPYGVELLLGRGGGVG